MLKKFAAFVMCFLVMMLPVLAEEQDMLGFWYLNNLTVNGVSVNPALVNMNLSYDVLEDGTVVVMALDENAQQVQADTGTWKMQDGQFILTTENLEQAFVCNEDGTITYTDAELSMTFGREAASQVLEGEASPAVQSPAAEDFDGEWKGAYVISDGKQLLLDIFGFDITVNIKDSVVEIKMDDEDSTSAQAVLTDAGLKIVSDGKTLLIALHENGLISLEQSGSSIYLERAA